MKLFLILFTIMATGCASQPYVASTEPDFRSPAQVRADRGYADNVSTGNSSISTVNLPSGSYLVGRQGSSISVIQTSKGRR
jgi:hypothetical protein